MKRLALSACADLGVLALLGPGGVSIAGVDSRARIVPDSSTVYLTALADSVRATGTRLAIGLPPFGRHLPLLFAVTSLLADTLKIFAQSGGGRTHAGGVLVITHDLELRSRYCDVRVGMEAFDDTYPGSRLLPDGRRVMLRPGLNPVGNSGVCFFLPPVSLPQKINFTPSLIVLDLRYSQWPLRSRDLSRWAMSIDARAGVVALYTIGDQDTRASLGDARYCDVPFDHAAIATCATRVSRIVPSALDGPIEWGLSEAPERLARAHVISDVQNSTDIEQLLTDLSQLLDEHQHSDNLDLQRATWILAVARQMPVPMIWYEEAARTLGRSPLKRLIERLGSMSRDERQLGPVVQTVRMGLQRLYDRLDHMNPRADAMRSQIAKVSVQAGERGVLVLVRDRTVERALRNWLTLDAFSSVDWIQRVTVSSCTTYARNAARRFEVALVNGALPRRYRWIAGASLGDTVHFIAYSEEVPFIDAQLLDVYGEPAIRRRATQRAGAIGALPGASSVSTIKTDHPDDNVHALRVVRPARRPEPGDVAHERPAKPRRVTREELAREWQELAQVKIAKKAEAAARGAAWLEDPGDDEVPGVPVGGDADHGDHGEPTECFRFDVMSRTRGSGVIWFPRDHVIEFMRPTESDDIQRDVARALSVGDVVLRVDEGGRSSVFDHIVELAESQPHMNYLARWRQAWRAAVERMASRYRAGQRINYGRLLGDLQRAGATVESELAVRFWVEDISIGPLTTGSIVAVGKVSGTDLLVAQGHQFDNAFRQIRAVRRGLGRRLSTIIRMSSSRSSGPPSGELDEHLRVPLEELLDTIDLAEVLSVSTDTVNVPASWVGRFRLDS